MSARAGIQVTSLEELLPAAESIWSRELAFVEGAPLMINNTLAAPFRLARKHGEPPAETMRAAGVAPPAS